MTGNGHIVSNCLSAVVLAGCVVYAHNIELNGFNTGECVTSFLFDMGVLPMSLYCILAFCLYFIGGLFPDVDTKTSLLGRLFYIPVEHRTWTHTIYLPFCLLVLSWFCRPLFYFAFGMLVHLFWDSLSKGGVCFFYPFSQYRYFGSNGAKIKKGHKFYLYVTGKLSEKILLTMLSLFTVPVVVYLFSCFFMIMFQKCSF